LSELLPESVISTAEGTDPSILSKLLIAVDSMILSAASSPAVVYLSAVSYIPSLISISDLNNHFFCSTDFELNS
jgi:hypothetical protein